MMTWIPRKWQGLLSPQMKKMLLIVFIVFGLIFGWKGLQKLLFIWFMSHYQPPPITVSATLANSTTWPSYLSSIGTLTAINGVDISTEAAGIVKEIHFTSGEFVHSGDILIILKTDTEEATLKNNLAQLKLAQINYERNQILSKRKVISPSVLDSSLAELQQAEAMVEESRAKIQQKMISAPFSGKIGIRKVNLGEYVAPGAAMVSLQQFDPLYVQFNLPEQYASQLYLQQPIEVIVNLKGSKPIQGRITAINSEVDINTRNLLIQATLPNPHGQLYPGMFANVNVALPLQKNVIVLPQSAISYSLHGDSVFILKSTGISKKGIMNWQANRIYVQVGEHRGNNVVILKGVKLGDPIVTSGQLKLENGAPVIIDNSVGLN